MCLPALISRLLISQISEARNEDEGKNSTDRFQPIHVQESLNNNDKAESKENMKDKENMQLIPPVTGYLEQRISTHIETYPDQKDRPPFFPEKGVCGANHHQNPPDIQPFESTYPEFFSPGRDPDKE